MGGNRSGKQPLLVAAVDDMAANGIRDRSLREIAAALGTSHRMLIYHFGSKDGLIIEVIRALEQRQRDLLTELQETGAAPGDVAREYWRRLSDPSMWPHERLFFEIYGRALQGDSAAAPMLDGIVDMWLEPLTTSIRDIGVRPDRAPAYARLGLAVARGLLLDLLATGDRVSVDEAMKQFTDMVDMMAANQGNPSAGGH